MAVAYRKPGRICAQPVRRAQPPHQQDGAHYAVRFPAPAGGLYLEAQAGGAAERAQAPRHGQILHQRNLRKPTRSLECGAPHEHRLVAGSDAAGPRAQVHRPGDHPQQWMAAGDAHVEAAPLAFDQRRQNGLRRGARQARVRMQEQQRRRRGGAGAAIHLHCAAGRAEQHLVGMRPGQACAAVRAAAIDHDELDALRAQRGQGEQLGFDSGRLVQRRNDDAEAGLGGGDHGQKGRVRLCSRVPRAS
jgi:hypothetical protein